MFISPQGKFQAVNVKILNPDFSKEKTNQSYFDSGRLQPGKIAFCKILRVFDMHFFNDENRPEGGCHLDLAVDADLALNRFGSN